MLGNGLTKFVGDKKYLGSTLSETYWATSIIARLGYKGKLFILTLDNDANNPLKVYLSTDSSVVDTSVSAGYYPQLAMKLVNTIDGFFGNPIVYVGVSKKYIYYKDENTYHITLFTRTESTNENVIISNFEFNALDYTITNLDYQYPDFNTFNGKVFEMKDRPGNFIKSQIIDFVQLKLIHFDSKGNNEITLPLLKTGQASAIDASRGIIYNKGKLYALTTFDNKLYLLSKSI